MFTGLVEATATLHARSEREQCVELALSTTLGPFDVGESISVSGVCLTVTSAVPGRFSVDVTPETLAKTTLGSAKPGAILNLERALRLGDRLGGHLVSGHIDGVAEVRSIVPAGEALDVTVDFPVELAEYIAPKGSVVLDGVSLTVNRVERASFSVMLIPHTREVTSLKGIEPQTLLNLEVDLLARYVVNSLRLARSEARHA